ncbi:MAG TPA: DUF3626 domain-containing protein [Candidatus Gallacutalibacter stercoravium]|nr:DUF3626 domain-containing protein [Candidatus Gallacutalibacter stercoravium]
MLNYQEQALAKVRKYAKINDNDNLTYLENICTPFHVNVQQLIDRVLQSPITINFHPDRFANNGKTVLQNLLEQGYYHGQFRTGTTNGGKTAFIGGDRFLWEQRMFFNSYPEDALDRPKYGALNIFRYIDGACVRFGSCHFILKQEIIKRCTFSYGDSSTNPTTLSTNDTFAVVLVELLKDVQKNGKCLNRVVSSEQETLAILLNTPHHIKDKGKNLDQCIETHIHGDISLANDIDSFYMDGSFKGTTFAKQAEALCRKYNIALEWIPKRQVDVGEIGDLFRGPMIPKLAKKIDHLWGNRQGIIDARLIGLASRDSILHPTNWGDIGNDTEVFQYLKQLWHTVGYFG